MSNRKPSDDEQPEKCPTAKKLQPMKFGRLAELLHEHGVPLEFHDKCGKAMLALMLERKRAREA